MHEDRLNEQSLESVRRQERARHCQSPGIRIQEVCTSANSIRYRPFPTVQVVVEDNISIVIFVFRREGNPSHGLPRRFTEHFASPESTCAGVVLELVNPWFSIQLTKRNSPFESKFVLRIPRFRIGEKMKPTMVHLVLRFSCYN